jgi:hypothetical protein
VVLNGRWPRSSRAAPDAGRSQAPGAAVPPPCTSCSVVVLRACAWSGQWRCLQALRAAGRPHATRWQPGVPVHVVRSFRDSKRGRANHPRAGDATGRGDNLAMVVSGRWPRHSRVAPDAGRSQADQGRFPAALYHTFSGRVHVVLVVGTVVLPTGIQGGGAATRHVVVTRALPRTGDGGSGIRNGHANHAHERRPRKAGGKMGCCFFGVRSRLPFLARYARR